MGKDQFECISAYLGKVEREWKTGSATEHSYRPMLKELMEALLPRIMVINEPKHIECGAPDYILRRGQLNVGFIEAKDIGDGDLDGREAHKGQFDRYKDSLETICFTDYLDFRFYDHFDFVDSARIAEVKGDRIVPADEATLERFVQLVARLGDARPQRITSPARLAQLMAGKAKLLAQGVRQYLGNEANAGSMLAQQMEAFRNVLIHDIDADSFADIFAQTVTYGMFAARLHDRTPEDFSRAEAATLIPKTNPLLRQMFQYIAMDTDDSIEWIIDDLVSLFAAVDVERLMRSYGRDTQKADPLLHFYEDFLAAYDPKLRKARGVWYTPKPVVDFIVRSVDRILERDFGLPGGLADSSKVSIEINNDTYSKNNRMHEKKRIGKEVHRVQILDPAAGTGTFLAETVRHIHSKVVAAMGEGSWQGYVADSLLPRLNGFEILMASYAMAHLKLDMLLAETGYEHRTNERLRVFLTNSLEPYDKEIGTLFAAALSQEANEANFVKRDCPVMVVMGNPPYSVSSANRGEWIQEKIAEYKKGLNEKKLNLDDDYIKFLRLGQYYVEKNGEGVLAFISNNSFIDGITHRQMRKSLLEAFDDIYVLNLHGNARKKETAPDGSKDENVFDIMQGVSINIFVKRGKEKCGNVGVCKCGNGENGGMRKCENANSTIPPFSQSRNSAISYSHNPTLHSGLATVHYADLYGVREDKYAFLDANALESVKWQTLALQEPYYFFVPKDFGLQEEYEKGFRIDELMPVYNSGIETKRDGVVVAFEQKRIDDTVRDFKVGDIEDIRHRYAVGADTPSWKLANAIDDLKSANPQVVKYAYRPFDMRYTAYTGTSSGFMGRSRDVVMRHLLRENQAMIVSRQCQSDWRYAFVSDVVNDQNLLSSARLLGSGFVFPLYLYNDNMGKVEKVPNFDAAIFERICAAVNDAPCLQASANTVRIREFLCGEPVAQLTGHEFEGVKGIPAITKVVHAFYRDVGWVADNPSLGIVRLTRNGINDSLHHGYGRAKLAAFAALPEIVEKAMVVNCSANWKGRGYESYMLAAPLEIAKEKYCAFAVVNRMPNNDLNFYLHEVGKLEYLKKHAGGLRSGSSDCSALSSTPGEKNWPKDYERRFPRGGGEVEPSFGSIRSLAYSIFAVNGGSKSFQPTPEDVFNYIYGVLHTPGYREKYREFLKIDFPRIPYPKGAAEFRRIAAVGERLVKVHLLKDESVTNPFSNPYAKFSGTGDGGVEKVAFDDGKVYISKSQWFEPVPEEAWNFYIGGYQPAQKWLKDRKGRALTADDQRHYRAIVAALVQTAALMKEL